MISYIVKREIVDYINKKQGYCYGELGEKQKDFLKKELPIIDMETARFLEVLLSMHKPKRILEIGLAVGFSSSLMAKILPSSYITSIERWDYMVEQAKLTHGELDVNVNIIEGDGLEVLKNIKEKYDFIFLDCAKGQYIRMLPYLLRILNIGGILFADDIFQNGNIVKNIEDIPKRQRTIHNRMNEFIDKICNTSGLRTSIIPIADGVSVSYKEKEIEMENYE
ncbi:MAG: O-methyltransferase [Lachnospirales bacterium]